MAQSLVKIIVHVVFSTKGRVRMITPEIEPRLFGFISGIIENNGAKMIIAGGDADHIHILISIGRADIAELIGDIKRETSKWMKQQDRRFEKFYWQRGYGAFSIGQSQVPAAKRYINSQKEHHKSNPFRTNFGSCAANTRWISTSGSAGIDVRRLQRREFRRVTCPRVALASLALP